jgi:hypothetical protein
LETLIIKFDLDDRLGLRGGRAVASVDLICVVEGGQDSGAELRSLWDWLRREEELRGLVRPVERPSRPGEMGAVLEALTVAVGTGGVGAVLAHSVSVWLEQRTSDLKVTITGGDGRHVELDARRVRDLQAVFREVNTLLEGKG